MPLLFPRLLGGVIPRFEVLVTYKITTDAEYLLDAADEAIKVLGPARGLVVHVQAKEVEQVEE